MREELLATTPDPRPTVPIAPAFGQEAAPVYMQPPRGVEALRLDTSHSVPISPVNGTPYDSPVASVQGASNEFLNAVSMGEPHAIILSHSSISHSGAEITAPLHISTRPPPSLHQVSSELGSLACNFLEDNSATDGSAAPSPTNAEQENLPPALDAETLRGFRSYIYPGENGPKWDEQILLRRLETTWRDKVRTYHIRTMGETDQPVFAAADRAFLTWIELRRHLADLHNANERTYLRACYIKKGTAHDNTDQYHIR